MNEQKGLAQMNKTNAPKVGQSVKFSGGFPGTVVRIYDHGTHEGREWWMVEVRGERGTACVSWSECEARG